MKLFSPRSKRIKAYFLITLIIAQLFAPYSTFALTGGPSQPEVQSFEPIGTSEMVDVSSGSFTYNIPLMEVGGYPINLAYHSGVSMDEEASCMGGLGWNINVGVINRNMRGLPDDFEGDEVKKEFNMKANETYGGKLGLGFELFGAKLGGGGSVKGGLNVTMGGFYNNYRGVGLEFGVSPSFSAASKGGTGMTVGIGLNANSASGVSLSPQIGLNFERKTQTASKTDVGYLTGGLSLTGAYNSRQGMQSVTMGATMGIKAKEGFIDNKGVLQAKSEGKSTARSLYGGDASFNFAAPTYTPGGQFSYNNTSGSMTFTIGGEVFGSNPSITTTGYFSKQELREKEILSPGYGFLYAQKGKDKYGAIMDFNREKDMPYTENTPNLPLPVFTNDVYSAVGQGIAGSYQLKRGDVGVLSDPIMQTFGEGANIGGEIGIGNAYHAGVDIVLNSTNSISQAGVDKNDAYKHLQFQDNASNNLFEPAYFKIAGEKAETSDANHDRILGGTQAVSVELDGGSKGQMNVTAKSNFDGMPTLPVGVKRTHREKRNQPISYLTAEKADKFGLETKIISYKPNKYGIYVAPTADTTLDRVDNSVANTRKKHHISEVTTLRQDGLRYVYGIPAYNTKQEEVGFSVNNSGNCTSGLVQYTGNENTVNNGSGRENYFNKTSMPPYAHAYLLTAVLSPDYVDVKNDGPTPDDLGTYTKFRYTLIQSNYRWRVPLQKDQANFNEGFKTDSLDDKANYVYGEKEYWVLNAVESKTQLAEFYYGQRNDGLGVIDKNGGVANTQKLEKLEKIVLFSLIDRVNNKANAEPIKTVHFEYNYELMQGIPNNLTAGGGKLTLKSLYFTYGRSQKGKLSPYKFEYNTYTGDPTYAYNIKSYNRWGAFQPNTATTCDLTQANSLSTSDYPYIPQNDRNQQDKYAAWLNINKITLPSGGVIKVEYEANDYAFVQNRRAMEMVEIAGFSSNDQPPTAGLENQLYGGIAAPNNFVFFKLPPGQHILGSTTKSNANTEIKQRYFSDPDAGGNIFGDGYLYFKCLVEVGKSGSNQYEYVPGYVHIESNEIGAAKSSGSLNYDLGYVKLKDACMKDKESKCNNNDQVSPISKAAWQFARLNLPRIAYGEPDPTAPVGQQLIQDIGALVLQYAQFFDGFNDQMRKKNFAKNVILNKSWIRLYSPQKSKIGGGARVKKVLIEDEWDKMSNTPDNDYQYGQIYDYTTVENSDTISSGVAAYEPLVGGDENPFRQPIPFKEEMMLAPDNNHYQEQPYGESYFPTPQIVYSKVSIRNLPRKGVSRTATGYAVQEYYTARDFPTKVSNTGVRPVAKRNNPIFRLLKIKTKDYMTASQGFAIELNDMHGKPKKQSVYDESGTKISGMEYIYKTDAQGLNNEVTVLRPDGKLYKSTIGLEIDLVADSRESTNNMTCPGVHFNSDGFLAGVFPFLGIVPLPAFSSEKTRFRSIATTKVIHRYGLLQTTIAYDLGSQVSTENTVWDSETGEVALTKTYNEHNDPIFNLNFPAHWAYQGMQGAYQNIGATFNGAINQGVFSIPNIDSFFMLGDELAINYGNTAIKGWVKDLFVVNSSIYIVDMNGNPIHSGGNCNFEIVRSGHRNQQLSSIGAVTSLQSPFTGNSIDFQGKQILQASSIQFDDHWQTWCGEKQVPSGCKCTETANSIATEVLQLLNNQISNNTFVLKPKLAPYNIPAGQSAAIKQEIDTKCPPPNGWTGIYPVYYYFATELIGNDLQCYFGKRYSDGLVCWFPCITIKNFGLMINSNPQVKVFNFMNMVANQASCDSRAFCFQANVETKISQQGIPYPFFQQENFTFCGSACFNMYNCINYESIASCGWQAPGDIVNPYFLNIRGIYRPKKSWTYLTDRVQQPLIATNLTNTRKDGYFAKFSSFWMPRQNYPVWVPNSTDWTWAKEVTRFNPVGNEIENKDALDRFSAELTGYANTQVTAVANNAKYRQIAFEGFEDYKYDTYNCSRHFGFELQGGDTTTVTSHTGKYSIEVNGQPISTKYSIIDPICPPILPKILRMEPYKLNICDCVGRFSPDPGNYVFSAWVKENQVPGTLNYPNAAVEIKTGGKTFTFKPDGQIIEGWQRIYGVFDVPVGAADIVLDLQGNGIKSWFDDLRIHPFDASFKSYVYDNVTLRFTYELDENNFFTQYQYDASGMLERVRKETERGVMTIQESRFGQEKQ
jgi:hypothetical protein